MTSKKVEDKLTFISLVKEKSEILFGRYDDSKNITKETKRATWIEIHQKLIALEINIVPPEKDWMYLRDVVWRNLCAAAKKKIDTKRRTGGGRVEILPVEAAVLDVLGLESPAVRGLDVPESWVSS